MSPSFDPGPPAAWEQLFRAAPLAHYIDHPSERFRTAFCPVFYRGRLDGSARVLIVGQDPSTDEILAQRILVGEAGQRVQGLLRKLGISRSYVMFNTFLYGVFGQFDSALRTIAHEPPIAQYRNQLLDQAIATNPIEAMLTVGNAASDAIGQWPGGQGLPVIALRHPSARSDVLTNWNARLPELAAHIAPDPGQTRDLTPYGATFQPQDELAIPAADLPFGLPTWHGSGGTRSTRRSPKSILWTAP
jgi:uracil-DNA glycosylase